MNYTFLTVYAIIAFVAIYTFCNQDNWHNSKIGWRVGTGVISFIALIIFSFASLSTDLGETTVETLPAKSQRIGNEIVVQATGFPLYVVSDIKYLDMPLKITRTIKRNAYGCMPTTTYTVDIRELSEWKPVN